MTIIAEKATARLVIVLVSRIEKRGTGDDNFVKKRDISVQPTHRSKRTTFKAGPEYSGQTKPKWSFPFDVPTEISGILGWMESPPDSLNNNWHVDVRLFWQWTLPSSFDGLTLLLCNDDLSKSWARTQFPGTQPYGKNNKAEIESRNWADFSSQKPCKRLIVIKIFLFNNAYRLL